MHVKPPTSENLPGPQTPAVLLYCSENDQRSLLFILHRIGIVNEAYW